MLKIRRHEKNAREIKFIVYTLSQNVMLVMKNFREHRCKKERNEKVEGGRNLIKLHKQHETMRNFTLKLSCRECFCGIHGVCFASMFYDSVSHSPTNVKHEVETYPYRASSFHLECKKKKLNCFQGARLNYNFKCPLNIK